VGSVSAVLKLKGGLTAAQEASLKSLGADITCRLPFIQSVTVRVPARRLRAVAALPFVTHLSADSIVKKCDDFTEGATGDTTAYQEYGLTGKGVIAVVLDSGVAPNPDLDTRYYNAVSFVAGDPSVTDKCGHGTHVAGIIAGSGVSSSGPGFKHSFHGIARGAFVASVRVLDQNGEGTVSSVLSGIQYVVAIKNQYRYTHPVVMNISLGHPVGESYTTDPLCQAVEAAWKDGIVVVCAAGNAGRESTVNNATASNEGWGTAYGSIQSPGNDPYIITVGATKSIDGNHAHDRIATYSSRGPSRLDLVMKPDIIASGNKVISLDAPGSYLATQYAVKDEVPESYYAPSGTTGMSSNYLQLSGTSMASPVVAGAAALLLQANPNLSPDTVKARLMISADKWVSPAGVADPCTYGAGYLDIPTALKNTVVATKPALSPALTEDGSGNVYLDASKIVSGSHLIWGTNVTDLHIIWGSKAIWGSNALSASHIIWGSSVWADHIIWGSSTDAVDLCTAAYGE
ncbi:MAG: S8 family serine peptidase, partial [Armatimonadota bacterium]|nr:S8 family serine peptidase [Armatimonadota bacterium]